MNYKATIKFNDVKQADEFAKQYSRRTLRGYIVCSDGTVIVDGLSENDRAWIDYYLANLNQVPFLSKEEWGELDDLVKEMEKERNERLAKKHN